MVSYFSITVKEIGWLNPDKVAKKLIELGLLTKDWNHVLLQERADWFIRNIAHSTTFSVSAIVPTPEVQTAINNSYTGIIQYTEDSKEVASVTELSILPEREIETEEEERAMSSLYMEEQIEDELLEEAITRVERADLKEQLVELENTIEAEPELINHQIETNESTDIDWF
jgi:hypothetical protein